MRTFNLSPFLMLSSILLSIDAVVALTPSLSPAVKESSEGFAFFLNLWEYSLKVDSKASPASERNNLEPKTLLLPGDYSMAHLVPQDGSHPLFMDDDKHSKLRKEFILDHLVLNVMPKNDPQISTPEGLTELTLSGKPITIRQESSGELSVDGVKVKKTVSLPDGCHIYVLQEPLFNQTQIVREAFDKLHQIPKVDALGPPLDIPGPFFPSEIRAPAPPPRDFASPPASPTEEEKRIIAKKNQPPAIPEIEKIPSFRAEAVNDPPELPAINFYEPEDVINAPAI